MNVNRYMHPRNKYKKPPDYKQLAILYPEFRKVAMTNLTGKVKIDFQNKESLRVLTETLLKHDFDLHVSIPPDNLNPALPLRMNYILWIEDLMKHSSNAEMDKITGIDIGTGAVCIYAVLLAKIYGCRVIGTELDEKSAEIATQCVRRNNLQDLVKVITVDTDRIFKNTMETVENCHFSMCNPPFFESEGNSERIVKALPPRNAPTGNETELKTEGGELAFVTRMIEESIELRDRIKIYTTMIGRKSDLFHLKKLIKSKHIENVTWTEFCQGHTTRWGLAWSFLPRTVMNLTIAPVIRKSGKSMVQLSKNDKTSIIFPADDKFSCIDDLINFIRETAKELGIKLQDVTIPKDSFDGWVCRITAVERAWEHARRKRRLAQRQSQLKKAKDENTDIAGCSSATIIITEEDDRARQTDKNILDDTSITKDGSDTKNEESINKTVPDERFPLLTCELWVEMERSEIEAANMQNDVFKIWMIFENGTGGLEALQSFRQYLINKLGVREKFLGSQKPEIKRRKKSKRKIKDSSEYIDVHSEQPEDLASDEGDTAST